MCQSKCEHLIGAVFDRYEGWDFVCEDKEGTKNKEFIPLHKDDIRHKTLEKFNYCPLCGGKIC